MDIRTGDYVTLKSVEEVKLLYEIWNVADDDNVTTYTDYFTESMIEAMESSDTYKVVEVTSEDVWIDIKGKMWCFDKMCIKDVYRLTKVN